MLCTAADHKFRGGWSLFQLKTTKLPNRSDSGVAMSPIAQVSNTIFVRHLAAGWS